MVDVGTKPHTHRIARAEAILIAAPETLALVQEGRAKKGDVRAVAEIAGIMAAKKTSDLIPLCHPLPLTSVRVEIEIKPYGLHVQTVTETTGQTGVEMEALTAASVAALTLYDMLKAVDRDMRIESVRLLEKAGGASGHFKADEKE